MATNRSDKYFANDEADQTVQYLEAKGKDWIGGINVNGYMERIKRSWNAYHGIYYKDAHEISYGGESGELVNIAVNHYHNFGQHMLTMVTSNRPAFQAKAVNTDHKSQVQVDLANDLLEYYMRQKNLDKKLKDATEYSIVLGTGYIKMEWNATKGRIYDEVEPEPVYDEDGDELRDEDDNLVDADGNILESIPVYEGDIEFKVLDPFDVMFDINKSSPDDHEWVVVRTFMNRFNLAAKFPEMKDKILDVPTKDKRERTGNRIALSKIDETEDVPVYEFFHKRTEACKNGRYTLYLNSDCILDDGPMPYRELPVYRISPSNFLGTPLGYSPMWDLLPIQDAVNASYSTILTNQTAFGVQNVIVAEGSNVKQSEIAGGLNFIDYTPIQGAPNGGMPMALNLTQTPAELFNYLGMLERAMETISGINSVTRGNPEQNLRSGNALALVQSQALQYISGLQQDYIRLVEDVGTGIIQILQDYAEAPRIAEIVGKSNTTKIRQFSRTSLDRVQRIIVDVGNALSQTVAGRAEMAQNLIQMGIITTPEQYFSVINSGNLEVMTEAPTRKQQLMRAENEALIANEPVIALATDDHEAHIEEHLSVLSDPVLRFDNELVTRVLLHVQEHKDLQATVAPQYLDQKTLAKQPPPQVPQTPPPPAVGGPLPASELAQQAEMGYNPQAVQNAAEAGVSMPTPPIDPATGLPLSPRS